MDKLTPAWTDQQLVRAVASSSNWRAVIRELGLPDTSAGRIRIVRRRAGELGLDTSHFRGGHRWSDTQLRSALSASRTWDEAIGQLGPASVAGNMRALLKSHAIRLGIDYSHLDRQPTPKCHKPGPPLEHLHLAAASIAAAWFAWSGCAVSIPVEPAIYDLLCDLPDGIKRVQVKTTTTRSRDSWLARIGQRPDSSGNRAPLVPYDPDEIDLFFIVDGDLSLYLIPSRDIAGRTSILVRAYQRYIVGNVREMTGGGGTARAA